MKYSNIHEYCQNTYSTYIHGCIYVYMQSCEALLADVLRLRRHVRLEARAREVAESRHSELLCPIGRELLLDPVVADDGHT